MGAHSEKTHIPTKGTEKRNKMPGPQLTRDDLNSLLIFENLCNDWVREVHRFTSERKKKKNFVIFRNCENKKLTSLEGLKEELEDTSFLENAEFKSAFSHDIVSNKVGANKRARRAAKAWMADPTKQGSKIAPVQEATPVEETAPIVEEVRVPEATSLVEESIEESATFVEEAKTAEETSLVEEFIQESAPVVEESIKIIQDDETKNEPEDIKSYEEVIIPVEDTPNVITEEEIAAPVEEQLISAVEQTPTDPVIEEATSVVEEEEKYLVEETPDVDVEKEAISSFEEITVPVEEEVTAANETDVIVPVTPVEEVLVIADEENVKAPVEETPVVEMKEDVQEIAAPLEEEISSPAVEEATSTVEETKESVAVQLPTVDVPSKLPEVELVITQTSEETNQIEESPSIDIDAKEKNEEESVPIVKAETERGDSVLSDTSDMGSMESLEAQTDSASTNSDDENENSCSDTDIFIPTSDEKKKDIEVEDIKIEIVQVL